MNNLLDSYQQQALAARSSVSWVAQLQETALLDFTRLNFPTRHQEAWKYLVADPFLKESFVHRAPTLHLTQDAVAVMATGRQTDAPVGLKIALVDGVVLGLDALQRALPPGVIVSSLEQGIHEYPEKIKPYLGKILPHDHAFQALNTAMTQFGLFIYVPKHIQLPEPFLLSHWQTTANQAQFLRHLIVLEEGAELSVIEDFQGDSHACYFTSTVTEVHLSDSSKLTHYKIQRESQMALHLGHVAVSQKAKSQLKSHVLSIGAKWSRSDISIQLQEMGSHCLLNGVYATRFEQQMGHHTQIGHLVPQCESEQDYKGILADHSRAVFHGEINVKSGAMKTIAKQQNKNLLLSAGAEIDTKPQLDIYADDVQCTHGATVGQLDEDALFYLTTRGIEQPEARRYLIQAFASENLKALNHEPLTLWMSHLLNQQMG